MNLDLDDTTLAIRREAAEFARDTLNEGFSEREHMGGFSRAGWQQCAEFGVQGLPFPAEYGGSEADVATTMLAMEGLGYGCEDAGLLFGINAQMWSVQMPISIFGTESQKRRYLPALCAGRMIGGHGMSEPDSGSDAFSMRTAARRDGDHWILNGAKTFVTNAPVADVFVVFANTDPRGGVLGISAFLIERGTPGVSVGREIGKLGLKTSPMAELALQDCRLTGDSLLGEVGQGATIFNSSMEWERGCILSTNLGIMQRQVEYCIRYAEARQQYGRSILEFQAIERKIADMATRIEAGRQLLYRVAWAKEAGVDAVMYAAAAKLYLSEAAILSSLAAVQIHGGYGFTTDFPPERELRNAIGGTLYSGTTEIQKNIIAQRLGL
jgi:alkylation response protein AidB-like acyl-CoA dehydrogenase